MNPDPNGPTMIVHRAILDDSFTYTHMRIEQFVYDSYDRRPGVEDEKRILYTAMDTRAFIENLVSQYRQPFIATVWNELLDWVMADIDWAWLAYWHVQNALDVRAEQDDAEESRIFSPDETDYIVAPEETEV